MAKDRWVIYFAYLPKAHLYPQHLYTLQRLREQSLPVLVVCATSDPAISGLIERYSDAIILKGLSGYDFSAYSLALNHLAERSPGSDVLIMNDSVYGPFTDLNHAMTAAPWDLTGFTSSQFVENHIQSYSFVLKNINTGLVRALGTPFKRFTCFNDFWTVVLTQETRFARIASRSMSVGSFWHSASNYGTDPSLHHALELVDNGFPFMKRSLLGKHRGKQSVEAIKDFLRRQQHPVG